MWKIVKHTHNLLSSFFQTFFRLWFYLTSRCNLLNSSLFERNNFEISCVDRRFTERFGHLHMLLLLLHSFGQFLLVSLQKLHLIAVLLNLPDKLFGQFSLLGVEDRIFKKLADGLLILNRLASISELLL